MNLDQLQVNLLPCEARADLIWQRRHALFWKVGTHALPHRFKSNITPIPAVKITVTSPSVSKPR